MLWQTIFSPWRWSRRTLTLLIAVLLIVTASYQASLPFGWHAAFKTGGRVKHNAELFYAPAMWLSDHFYPFAKFEQWEWRVFIGGQRSGGRRGAAKQVERWEAWWAKE